MVTNRTDSLGPGDWIAAALAAMADGGIQAVRVDPLARALGVTRGSFYWHFRDRQALLDALLDAWGEQQTEGVVARAGALGLAPAQTLRALLGFCFEDDGRLEKALRSWATQDAGVADAIAAVDQRRVDYLAALLRASGIPGSKADARARVAYRAWLGDYALVDRPQGQAVAEDIDELHALLLA